LRQLKKSKAKNLSNIDRSLLGDKKAVLGLCIKNRTHKKNLRSLESVAKAK
jgi:hypothetical protein